MIGLLVWVIFILLCCFMDVCIIFFLFDVCDIVLCVEFLCGLCVVVLVMIGFILFVLVFGV